jgi:hypothetical protein
MTECLEQPVFSETWGYPSGNNPQNSAGDDAMGVAQIKEWFNRFKNGRLADTE